jgi:hypothetical protein
MKQKHLNRLMDRMLCHEEKIQSLINSRIVINQTLMEALERINHLEALYELNH